MVVTRAREGSHWRAALIFCQELSVLGLRIPWKPSWYQSWGVSWPVIPAFPWPTLLRTLGHQAGHALHPSCNHVACHFGLFPTFRLYLDSLAQPCAVWFRLFSVSYLIRLAPVSFFSAISPSSCICNTAFLYIPVRYSQIQPVQILTRFPPLSSSEYGKPSVWQIWDMHVVQGTALHLSRWGRVLSPACTFFPGFTYPDSLSVCWCSCCCCLFVCLFALASVNWWRATSIDEWQADVSPVGLVV